MALPSAPSQISHSDIMSEFGITANSEFKLSADGATLINFTPSTTIKESDFYGASASTPIVSYLDVGAGNTVVAGAPATGSFTANSSTGSFFGSDQAKLQNMIHLNDRNGSNQLVVFLPIQFTTGGGVSFNGELTSVTVTIGGLNYNTSLNTTSLGTNLPSNNSIYLLQIPLINDTGGNAYDAGEAITKISGNIKYSTNSPTANLASGNLAGGFLWWGAPKNLFGYPTPTITGGPSGTINGKFDNTKPTTNVTVASKTFPSAASGKDCAFLYYRFGETGVTSSYNVNTTIQQSGFDGTLTRVASSNSIKSGANTYGIHADLGYRKWKGTDTVRPTSYDLFLEGPSTGFSHMTKSIVIHNP